MLNLRSLFSNWFTSFQVLSDLHLEINQQYLSFEIPERAKYLILAGDVGRLVDYDNYLSFLQKQTDRFELVFLVLGNHEFYNDTFAAGIQRARQLEQEPSLNGRLVLLHQGRYDIPGTRITILGCTLWSKVPDEARGIVSSQISDFKHIHGWTVDDHNASHQSDLAWLLSEIQSAQANDKRQSFLVVTHHAPLLNGTSSPQYTGNPWSSAFGTDVLSQIPRSSGVKVWVFGHTHYTTEFRKQGVRVVANQRGYVLPWTVKGSSKDKFDSGKVIYL